jgi:hypothetical protein
MKSVRDEWKATMTSERDEWTATMKQLQRENRDMETLLADTSGFLVHGVCSCSHSLDASPLQLNNFIRIPMHLTGYDSGIC